MKLFVDTNVLVSGLAFSGNEALLLELGRMGVCELVVNEYVLDEVRHVLARSHLGLEASAQRRAVAYLGRCVAVLGDPPLDAVRSAEGRLHDQRDLPILLGFELSGADHLVTGDAELRRQVPRALTTRAAVERVLFPE